MSIANTDLANFGGRFNTDLGMLLGTLDVDRVGELAIQSLVHTLSILFYDDKVGTPVSGFPHSDIGGSNCTISATADLVFDVESGWGLLFDSSLIGSDAFGSGSYQMVILGTGTVGETLAAHHATLPRNDLICLKPIRTGTQAATRNIKDPTTGVLSTSSVDLKDNLNAEVAIITGTPATTPVDPVLPAGHLLIGRAEVPATSGAAVLRDARQPLNVGNFLAGAPGNDNYQKSHVHPLGTSTELETTETAPATLGVLVARGRAVIDGTIRLHPRETIALTTADPTNPRIDLIVARRDGTLAKVDGTPAGSPAIPSKPANSIAVAQIAVAALASSIVNANITDVRNRAWLNGGEAVRTGTLPHQVMTTIPFEVAVVSVTTPDPDVKRVNYQLQYPDGTLYDGALPVDVVVEVYQTDTAPAPSYADTYVPTNGSTLAHSASPSMVIGLPTDMILFPGAAVDVDNISDGAASTSGSRSGRMLCTVKSTTFYMELARETTATPAGTVFFGATPTGPQGLPCGHTEMQPVTFL